MVKPWRRMSRIGLVLLLPLTLLPAAQATKGSAASLNPQFTVSGTVIDANAPVSPTTTSVPDANQAFTIQVQQASDGVSGYESDGQLTIEVGAGTNYYLQDGQTGGYVKSDYQHTIIQSGSVEVYGRYVTTAAGTQFSAENVWNPPETPTASSGSSGSAPSAGVPCPSTTTVQSKEFLISATVGYNRADAPCFSGGNYPTGFHVYNPTYESPGIDGAFVDAPANSPTIVTTPLTKYALGAGSSTWATVVQPGALVNVWGTYYQAGGGWLLVARLVWASPPPPSSSGNTPITETANIDGSQSPPTSNSFVGVVSGSGFSGDSYSGQWSCVPDTNPSDPGGTAVSGTWKMSNGNNTVAGTFAGSVTSNGDIGFNLTITSGAGYYSGTQGGGTMAGTASPAGPSGICPQGFSGPISLTYTFG